MKCKVLGCNGSYPAANGACAGYLLMQGDDMLQMDMGCGVLPRLMALTDPANLGAVILTHWHFDHASDLLPLCYYLKINKLKLKVLAPPQTHPLREILTGNEYEFLDISKPRTISGFEITSIRVEHPVPAYAVRIQRDGKCLVYTGDVAGGEGLAEFCRGADLLICDATFTKAQYKEGLPHFTSSSAGELARKAGVKRLMLTHIPPNGEEETLVREAKNEFPESFPARLSMNVEV